jgi:hypothetical protein
MKSKIAFCIVDDIETYANGGIQSMIKNIADYTISNLVSKGYDVFVDKDEDKLLQGVTDYNFAVVMSPGTEYINGYAFFEALKELVKKDFCVAGHVLDRTTYNAYYELHHQCYVVNMAHYHALHCPIVGISQKDISHTQIEPIRSTENWHDDYTPKFINKGTYQKEYTNRCHGWNLLRLAFENNLPVLVFDESIRNNKKHYYPESEQDYYKEAEYIKQKFDYCKEEFIHVNNTEWTTGISETYEQLVLPASGTLYLDLINQGKVIFYDYNQRALEYWKEHFPRKDGVEYVFVLTNLLEELSILEYLEPNLKTLINLSNIFSYEGTVSKYSLRRRIDAQDILTTALTDKIKTVDITFSQKADAKIFDIATWHHTNQLI